MSQSDFIDDGYTEDGYIAAEAGIHGELSFRFRPILVARRDTLNALFLAEKHEDAIGKISDDLSRAVQEWSLKDAKGNPVLRSAANFRRIKPRLFDKLWQIVSGSRASDPRPDCNEQPKPVDLEADAKN